MKSEGILPTYFARYRAARRELRTLEQLMMLESPVTDNQSARRGPQSIQSVRASTCICGCHWRVSSLKVISMTA